MLAANPEYWNKGSISLSAINIGYITTDTRSLMNLYVNNELASFSPDETTLKDVLAAGLKVRQARSNCINILTMNFREGRVTANASFRKALQAVFDPEVYVNRIIAVPANVPAYSVFTSHIQSVERPFLAEFPPAPPVTNRKLARQHLAQARQELGELPRLVLLASDGLEKQMEYLQALFRSELDLDVIIDKQSFKQAIVKLINGEFDIANSSFCSGSLFDPAFYAGILESTGTFNDGRFNNTDYDRLLSVTRSTRDQRVRMNAFAQMQQIVIDEVAVLPTHEIGSVYVQRDSLRGVTRFPGVDFTRARIRR
jgi:oligopeptide transport system substrate-binding protein